MNEKVKICAGCKRSLGETEFQRKGNRLQSRCRQCRADDRITVKSEPSVYRRDGKHSFFRDLVKADKDPSAQERLFRHREETESRDITSQGGAAGLLPPGWVASEYANLSRAPRVLADRITSIPMPPSGQTFKVPRLTGGASVAMQATEIAGVSETDITSDAPSYEVVEIAGMQDGSRQAFDRSLPGLDMVVYSDLMRAYGAKLEDQLLHGSGTSGQVLGLRNVSSIITVTYTQATPAQDACLVAIAQAVSKIATQNFSSGVIVLAHPRRLAWLSAASGTASLSDAPAFQSYNFNVDFASDPSLATNLGASTNQDEIFVVDPSAFFLAEDQVRLEARDVLSGNLTVRLQAVGYVLAGLAEKPKAIAAIDGTGLVAPSGY
jgi:Phage capsid family